MDKDVSPMPSESSPQQVGNDFVGVQGFLLFLCVWLTIIRPLVFLFLLGLAGTSAFSHAASIFNNVLDIIFILFGIWVGVKLWTLQKEAVMWTKAFFWWYAFIAFIAMFITFALIGSDQEITYWESRSLSLAAWRGGLAPIVAACVFLTYLSRSKRVRATYRD